MRFSKLFIPTTKDAPKDAQIPSHIYLLRGGFIVQNSSGIYNFLPLGLKVLENIIKIIDQELQNAGCLKTKLSFVTPYELWEESGRAYKYGNELLKFKDRKLNNFVLGPTHEEAMVDLVRNRVKSYKDLPLNLYQIGTKFRDELRPRYGLLRTREFIMKDGYSFHDSKEDMQREFSLMQETYSKIFTKLKLDFRVVEADSGAIGGSGSKEFMALSQNGEDDIVICSNCSYGANIEAAKRQKLIEPLDDVSMNPGNFYTPNVTTIKEVADFFRIDPYYIVKAVAKKAIYKDTKKIVIFYIRGCDNLQEIKALSACGALELKDVDDSELMALGIVPGSIPPGLENVTCYVDIELKDQDNLICGANLKDYHYVGFSFKNRDYNYVDLAQVRDGDKCIECGSSLSITKGIEAGHIFQLYDTYSKPLNATFLDKDGKAKPFIMGTYGIGVSRLIAILVEQNHDEKGMIWHREVAPYEIDIVISNIKDNKQVEFANDLYKTLNDHGFRVILDDRSERFGFKMKDFELIGFPYAIVVGKSLDDGFVELITRKTLVKNKVDKDKILQTVLDL